MPELFISHSSRDADHARALRAILEAAGYTCWMAPDDVIGTDPWASQILTAIESSRAMLVLVSGRSNGSEHVPREVELANGRGRIVLPIRIEDVRPSGALEYHLTGRQRIDAFPPPISSHRDLILQRIEAMVPLQARVLPSPPPLPDPVPQRGRGGPNGGLGAWARANAMLTGVAVTLIALFVVGAAAMALSGAGPAATPAPTAQVAFASPTTSTTESAPTQAATASASPLATEPSSTPSAPPKERPPVGAGGVFPTAAEVDLFMSLPYFAARSIEDCSREDGPPEGLVAAIWCYAANGEHVLYEQWPDVATVRSEYHTALRISLRNPVGNCATDPMGDAEWIRDGQVAGRIACNLYAVGQADETFVWSDESRRVMAWWFGSGTDEPGGDHALGNATFQAWIAAS